MSLFERIKNIRYDLQEKKKFSGDESGAYKRAKADIETKNIHLQIKLQVKIYKLNQL